MRKGLVAFAEGLRAACLFLVALWLAALYGLVGDLEGFERWREWFERRRD
jgi:type IV secretory pathway TrbD component